MAFTLSKKFIKGVITIPDSIYVLPPKHKDNIWLHKNLSKLDKKRIFLRKTKFKRYRIKFTYFGQKRFNVKYRKVYIKTLYRKYLQKLVGFSLSYKERKKQTGEISINILKEYTIHSKVLTHVLLRNLLIMRGKKVYAQNIVDLFFIYVKKYLSKRYPLLVLDRVISKLCPLFSVRTKKVAGQKLKVPVYLKVMRRYFLAFTWLIEGAEQRKDGSCFAECLTKECRDMYKNKGYAFKKRLDLCKEVDDSRVNLRFVK